MLKNKRAAVRSNELCSSWQFFFSFYVSLKCLFFYARTHVYMSGYSLDDKRMHAVLLFCYHFFHLMKTIKDFWLFFIFSFQELRKKHLLTARMRQYSAADIVIFILYYHSCAFLKHKRKKVVPTFTVMSLKTVSL